MKIQILGIAGTFMSGVAILAKQKGHDVSGSDLANYDPIKSVLQKNNIDVTIGYKIKDIKDKDLIIIGNVMTRGNSVIEYILKNKINFTSGPKWLYENILKDKKVIAVSGTHGKTTTTSMIVHLMTKNKLNPSYLIGGDPKGNTPSVKLTKSEYFVIEADEYDTAFFDKQSKFMHYNPYILLINNIEFDHADIFHDLKDIIKSFHNLLRLISSDGKIIINKNDLNIKKLLTIGYWSKVITIDTKKTNGDFNLIKDNKYEIIAKKKRYQLPNNLIGYHNYLNAAAAIAVCSQLKINIKKQIKSLESFKGVQKRMEFIGEFKGVKIYDDFAHHPTAIKAAITAVMNKYKNQKLLTIFLPNSNSMHLGTHDDRLASSLNSSNSVLIITKSKRLKKLFRNNIKINVIECKSQIGDYLISNNCFDNILILSNKNTKDIIEYIKK
jgi:UDP-N-acetylmuramate: L-alanyl-gamma-D-glutamyl-meso-diaminopimelate ligase